MRTIPVAELLTLVGKSSPELVAALGAPEYDGYVGGDAPGDKNHLRWDWAEFRGWYFYVRTFRYRAVLAGFAEDKHATTKSDLLLTPTKVPDGLDSLELDHAAVWFETSDVGRTAVVTDLYEHGYGDEAAALAESFLTEDKLSVELRLEYCRVLSGLGRPSEIAPILKDVLMMDRPRLYSMAWRDLLDHARKNLGIEL